MEKLALTTLPANTLPTEAEVLAFFKQFTGREATPAEIEGLRASMARDTAEPAKI